MDDERRAWFRKRILRAAAGLLSPEDEARYHAILAEDPTCARWHHEAATGELESPSSEPEDPDEWEHLPSAWLANWEQAKAKLGGLERRLAEAHLERCTSCREDAALARRLAAAAAGPKVRTLPTAAHRRRWWVPAAGLAMAAGLALMLLLPSGELPVQLLEVADSRGLPAARLRPIQRGTPAETEIVLEPGADQLVLDPSALRFAYPGDLAEVSLEIVVILPDGTRAPVLRTTADRFREQRIRIGSRSHPAPEGTYNVEIRTLRPGQQPVVRTYPVRVQREGSG